MSADTVIGKLFHVSTISGARYMGVVNLAIFSSKRPRLDAYQSGPMLSLYENNLDLPTFNNVYYCVVAFPK